LQSGVGAAESKPRAVNVDNVGANFTDGLVTESKAVDGVGADIVNENVGRFEETTYGSAPRFGFHVPAHRALAAIEPQVHRAHEGCLRGHANVPRSVTVSRFDLDHVGAEIGEDLSAVRSEYHRGHIRDANAS